MLLSAYNIVDGVSNSIANIGNGISGILRGVFQIISDIGSTGITTVQTGIACIAAGILLPGAAAVLCGSGRCSVAVIILAVAGTAACQQRQKCQCSQEQREFALHKTIPPLLKWDSAVSMFNLQKNKHKNAAGEILRPHSSFPAFCIGQTNIYRAENGINSGVSLCLVIFQTAYGNSTETEDCIEIYKTHQPH